MFFCLAFYVNAAIICFTIGLLPDWTINEFVVQYVEFITWLLVHGMKVAISGVIIMFLVIILSYRERVAAAAGVEHIKLFRFGKWKYFGFGGGDTHVVSITITYY